MKKNHFQKLLSAALALVMILSTLVILPLTVGAAEALPNSAAWDGSTKTKPAGEGTKDSPYQIASAENLAWIAYESKYMSGEDKDSPVTVCYLTFTANIDLNDKLFSPIAGRRFIETDDKGTPDNASDDILYYSYTAFVVEGNGATVKGLSVSAATSAGLFSYVGNGSSFSNLKLAGAHVTSNGTYSEASGTGALVGEIVGYADFYNCHVDAESTVTGVGNIGGLVGYFNAGKATDAAGTPIYTDADGKMTVSYCTNAADVTCNLVDGGISIGGIIGRIKTDCDFTIKYCANYGDVLANKVNNLSVVMGGITGQIAQVTLAQTYEDGDNITYSHLVNYGATVIYVVSDGESSTSYNWMGGVSGHFNMGAKAGDESRPYHTLLVEYCFDMGIKSYTKSTAATKDFTASVGYTSGNCADWQQYKTYRYIYGVKDANAVGESVVDYIVYDGSKSPATINDVAEVLKDTDEIMLNMTKTTVKAEADKVVAAIAALTTAEMGGEPISDGQERDFTWYTPEGGTKEAPYQIANAAAWAAMVDLSLGRGVEAASFADKYFKLTGDIDLTGYILYPVATNGATIHLDGDNHTISNANLYSSAMALFTELGRGSEVRNLKLSHMNFEASGNSGFVAVSAKAGLKLYNVHADDTCSIVSSGDYVGAFVGSAVDMAEVTDSDMINVQFCTNAAPITGRKIVGGMLGYLRGSYAYNFDFCVNKGALTATGNTENYVGGLFGAFTRNLQPSYSSISNCYNTGKLTTMTSGSIWLGALWGDLRAVDGSEVFIQNCYDYSARSVVTNGKSNGGLCGYADNVQLTKFVYNCYVANAPDSDSVYGSIGGWTASGTLIVDMCNVQESLTDDILGYTGESTTMQAEMEKIDAGIAALTFNDLSYIEGQENLPPVSDPSVTPDTPSDDKDKDETKAADVAEDDVDETTDAPAEEGCGSSVSATFAVLALTAACGMAIVGKKKED